MAVVVAVLDRLLPYAVAGNARQRARGQTPRESVADGPHKQLAAVAGEHLAAAA